MIHRLLRKRVHQTISIIDTQPPTDKKISAPLDAPEILPFAESDNDSTTYEESWTKHLDALMKIFHHVTK